MSKHALLLSAAALIAAPLLHAQTGQPFANPGEITRHTDGTFQAVMILGDTDRSVPNLGPGGTTAATKHLRYFSGYDPATPSKTVPANPSVFTPGPTLRMRVGDRVQIMLLNTINDANFQYTTVTSGKDDNPAYGCDAASNLALYPAKDVFPNCFHGSSTANIHFHGTHVNPDGLGDNVLVQLIPDKTTTAASWSTVFKQIFAMPNIPAKWSDMPAEYRDRQMKLVSAFSPALWHTDEQQIASGQWPQYLVGAFPNTFDIPDQAKTPGKYTEGQAPGTHWYHTHKHGSTSLHSLNGLAGAIIIEGPYDDFLKTYYGLGATYGNFEKVVVFQLVNPDQNLQRQQVNFAAIGPGTLLVNGLNQPVMTMHPGEVQLWRVLNATNGATFTGIGPGVIGPDLFNPVDSTGAAAGFTFKQTARDGVQFSPVNYDTQPFLKGIYPNAASGPTVPAAQKANTPPGLSLAGGNRADVLVQAPTKTGTYTFTSNGATVFTVNVTGTADTRKDPFPTECPAGTTGPNCWPAMRPDLADLPAPADYPHHVTFGWDAEQGRPQAGGVRLSSTTGLKLPPRYTIDNRQFEQFGPLIDQCMPLNATQDWVLENQTTVTHPFHIHINPFQIVKIEAPLVNAAGDGFTYQTWAPQNNFPWADVVPIPAGVTLANGQFIAGRATIRQHFVDFTGTWVLHCHILGHEDRGMMQLVRVVPAASYPSRCQAAIPQHH